MTSRRLWRSFLGLHTSQTILRNMPKTWCYKTFPTCSWVFKETLSGFFVGRHTSVSIEQFLSMTFACNNNLSVFFWLKLFAKSNEPMLPMLDIWLRHRTALLTIVFNVLLKLSWKSPLTEFSSLNSFTTHKKYAYSCEPSFSSSSCYFSKPFYVFVSRDLDSSLLEFSVTFLSKLGSAFESYSVICCFNYFTPSMSGIFCI